MTIKRIHSKGAYRQEEAYAGEAGIKPGMLVKLHTNGKLLKHSTQGGDLGDEVLVAVEDALQGKTVSDAYDDASLVTYIIPNKGSVVNMLLKATNNASIGNKLCSASGGVLELVSGLSSNVSNGSVVGVAEEACDLSASGAVDTLTPVRIV